MLVLIRHLLFRGDRSAVGASIGLMEARPIPMATHVSLPCVLYRSCVH